MSGAWAALLGAVIGGVFALAGSLFVELRRDRRRQISAARLVVAESKRGGIELEVELDMKPQDRWFEGPHSVVSAAANSWRSHAAEFVGALKPVDFERIDALMDELAAAGEYGFTRQGAKRLSPSLLDAWRTVEPVAKPTWFDRYVWRL